MADVGNKLFLHVDGFLQFIASLKGKSCFFPFDFVPQIADVGNDQGTVGVYVLRQQNLNRDNFTGFGLTGYTHSLVNNRGGFFQPVPL